MEYARKLIARRLVSFRTRSLIPTRPSQASRRYHRRGAPVVERLRASVIRRVPSAEDLKHRRRGLQHSAGQFARNFRSRNWLIRAGCAGGAVLLFVFLIASSHSPLAPANLLAGPGHATGANTLTGPAAAVSAQATPAPIVGAGAPATPSASASRKAHSATAPPGGSSVTTTRSHASSSLGVASHNATTTAPHSSTTSSQPTATSTTPSTATSTTPATSTTTSTTSTATAGGSSVPGCAQSAIRCNGGLVYTFHGSALASAPAISITAYHALAKGTDVAQTIQTLGNPMSVAALKAFIGGSSFLSELTKSQPTDDSCAYYLAARDRAARAYQLCFDSAQDLVGKAIISTSGSASSSSASGA